MTDLINKVLNMSDVDAKILLTKYEPLLQVSGNVSNDYQKIILYLAVLDSGINYIKENHPDINIDLKCWSIVVLKHEFQQNKIDSDSSIKISIDKFIEHCNLEYQKYLDDIGIYSCEYHRDREFIFKYLNM